jgi:DNA polymerase-3 subunit delta'
MSSLLNTYVPELSNNDVLKLADLAEGSIGRAVDLLEAGGLDLYHACLALLSSLPQLNTASLHTLANQLSKTGAEEQFTTAMNLLRNILARLIRYKAEGLLSNGQFVDETRVFERIGPAVDLDCWLEIWEKVCSILERAGAVNLDRKQVVLNVFIIMDVALSK